MKFINSLYWEMTEAGILEVNRKTLSRVGNKYRFHEILEIISEFARDFGSFELSAAIAVLPSLPSRCHILNIIQLWYLQYHSFLELFSYRLKKTEVRSFLGVTPKALKDFEILPDQTLMRMHPYGLYRIHYYSAFRVRHLIRTIPELKYRVYSVLNDRAKREEVYYYRYIEELNHKADDMQAEYWKIKSQTKKLAGATPYQAVFKEKSKIKRESVGSFAEVC